MRKTQKRIVRRSPITGRFTVSQVASAVRAIHIAPRAGTWLVHRAGPKRISVTFPSRDEAVNYAKILLQETPTQILVHGRNGKIVRQAKDPARSSRR